VGSDQLDIDPRGDQEFERRIVGRFSEAKETPVDAAPNPALFADALSDDSPTLRRSGLSR